MIWMDMDQEKMNQQEAAAAAAAAAEGVSITGGDVSATPSLSTNQSLSWKRKTRRSRSRSFSKPSWLLSTIADLDERTKMLALKSKRTTREEEEEEEEEKKAGDSFAERAEDYYLKRPQLLALLQDLYNGYLSLADRYCQTLAIKHQHCSQSTAVNFEEQVDFYEEEEEEDNDIHEPLGVDSDAESSLSYQPPIILNPMDGDAIVAELVMKAVNYDILVNEVRVMERWSRKTELQKSLVEVLESERLILLNENARLGYKVTALVEENRGLAAETLFMKRKAGELERRCVLEMRREDHRVCMCMLSRKIEDLQGQIYGLEYNYDQLVKKDDRHYQGGGGGGAEKAKKGKSKSKKKQKKKGGGGGGGEVTLDDCFQVNGEEEDCSSTGTAVASSTKKGLVDHHGGGGGGGGRKVVSKWWDRVKNFDLFQCGGPHNPNFTFC